MRSRSKRGLPGGLSRGVSALTTTRHASCRSLRASTSSGSTLSLRHQPLIKPSQTAVTGSGTAPRRAAVPAREQRHRGDQTPEPDHPGWAAYYRTRFQQIFGLWITTCEAHLQVGDLSHHNQPSTSVFRRYFGKFNKSRQTGRVSSATAIAAATSTASVGRACPAPARQARSVTRRSRAYRVLRTATTQGHPADQQHQPVALPSPGRPLRDLPRCPQRRQRTGHNSRTMGTMARLRRSLGDQTERIAAIPGTARIPSHPRPMPPGKPDQTSARPKRLQGELEPDARERARNRLYVRRMVMLSGR